MTKQEHDAIIAQLQGVVPVENQSLLLTLSNDYGAQLTSMEESKNTIETLTSKNADYQKVNNSLWLQLTTSDEKQKTDILQMAQNGNKTLENTAPTEEEEKLPSFEDLLKEGI
jgi:hypothetical protein